jgi:hypothetical protein
MSVAAGSGYDSCFARHSRKLFEACFHRLLNRCLIATATPRSAPLEPGFFAVCTAFALDGHRETRLIMTKTAAIPFQALLGGLFLALGTLIPAASAATPRADTASVRGYRRNKCLFPPRGRVRMGSRGVKHAGPRPQPSVLIAPGITCREHGYHHTEDPG